MTTTEPLRTAIYLRISEDRRDGAGVERQEKECRELAERLGWQITHVLVDNDISAYNGKHRPDYERLCGLISTGGIDAVIAWHPDRLHRQPKELEPYIELCDRRGVQNAAVRSGRVDLTTPSGQLNARMLGAVAYYESQHKAERVRSAHRQLAERGGWHGGIRCFGYEADGATVREDEAAEIRRIADAVIRGQSLRSLALELNERGVPTVKGKDWTSSHLGKMLIRTRLAGLREHQGKIIGEAAWPAILDRSTWESVKAVLEDPSRCSGGSGRRGPVPSALGTGIYICGVCNEPRLRLGRTNAHRAVYRCGNKETSSQGHVCRVAEGLDAFVEGALLEVISRPGAIEAMCAVIDADDTELAELARERATIRPRLNQAAKRYAAGEIDDEQFAIVSKMLRERENEITATLTASAARSPLDVLLGAESVAQMWDEELTMGQKRAILAEVLNITVLPTTKGGRAPDGSYFNPDGVRIELTALAQARLAH